MRYGPSTIQVQRLLDRAQELTGAERAALEATFAITHGTGPRRALETARDFSWHRLHEALASHGLTAAFHTLWGDLRVDPRAGTWVGVLIVDAACATLLTDVCDQAGFSTSDHDCLKAPWCAVLDNCPRSRLFLQLMPTGRPAGELWPVVDAAISPPPGQLATPP